MAAVVAVVVVVAMMNRVPVRLTGPQGASAPSISMEILPEIGPSSSQTIVTTTSKNPPAKTVAGGKSEIDTSGLVQVMSVTMKSVVPVLVMVTN